MGFRNAQGFFPPSYLICRMTLALNLSFFKPPPPLSVVGPACPALRISRILTPPPIHTYMGLRLKASCDEIRHRAVL